MTIYLFYDISYNEQERMARNHIITQNTCLTRIRLRDVYMNGDVSFYQQQLFKA